MTDPGIHLARAKAIRVQADILREADSRRSDWAFVMYAYAALHSVDAYLALIGVVAGDHRRRNELVVTEPFLCANAAIAYKLVHGMGWDARYKPDFVWTKKQLSECEAAADEIIAVVEKQVRATKAKPAKR